MSAALRALLAAAFALAWCTTGTAHAATITVHFLDAQGSGFFDGTLISSPPGSSAQTLGEARRIAFQYAVSIWARRLASDGPIEVDAHMDALPCSATFATLGTARANSVHADFPGAPLANTWYLQALANDLASRSLGHAVDLDPSTSDIEAVFSDVLDSSSCLGSTSWYYGLDAKPLGQTIDFVSTVLHELGHGLGFSSTVDMTTGAQLAGRGDVFTHLLEQHGATPATWSTMTDAQRAVAATSDPDLHWLGASTNATAATLLSAGFDRGHVRIYGPTPVQPGGNGSHFSNVFTPNQLLEPIYTGAIHDPGLAVSVMADLGWRTTTAAAVPAVPAPFLALMLLGIAGCLTRLVRRAV